MSHSHKHRRRRQRPIHSAAPPGSAPGTLIVNPYSPRPKLCVFAYSNNDIIEREIADPDELRDYLTQWPVVWLNVEGLGDEATLRKIGDILQLHHLTLEDIVNVYQRPKVEPYPSYLFFVFRDARLEDDHLDIEQMSLIVGENFVITLQEHPGDSFDQIRQRLRQNRGNIREKGADHLCYALLDAIVDAQFPLLECYGNRLEDIEDQVLSNPTREAVAGLFEIKRELLALRRAMWPQRDVLSQVLRDRPKPFTEETLIYLRDAYDHTIRIADMIESYRELATAMMEVYLSSVSNRTNEIVKVLTMISVIFIPLTFIAGIYGMNFDTRHPLNMPELRWPLGYIFSMGLMAATAAGILWYFRRKGWIGGRGPESPKDDRRD